MLQATTANPMNSTQRVSDKFGGARGVMVIVVWNGHGDTSSNPGRDWLHFHIALIPLGKVWIQLFSLQLWVGQTRFFSLG